MERECLEQDAMEEFRRGQESLQQEFAQQGRDLHQRFARRMQEIRTHFAARQADAFKAAIKQIDGEVSPTDMDTIL
jgi:hypothetical protein